MRSKVIGALSIAVAAVGLFAATAPALAQGNTITVWWGKGFYKSEDDALLETIKKFEAKTGIKVELSQYAIQDMIPEDGRRAGFRHRARRRLFRHLRRAGPGQVGL